MNSSTEVPCGGAVISVAMTPSGSAIAVGSVTRELSVLRDGSSVSGPPFELDNEVWSVAITDSGELVAAGTASKAPSDGTLYCFAPSGRRLIRKELGAPVWGVAFSPSGEYLAAATWNGVVIILRQEGSTFREIFQERRPDTEAGCYGIRVFDDGRVIVAIYNVGIAVLDMTSGQRGFHQIETGIYNLAIAHDSKIIAVGTRQGSVLLLEAKGVMLSEFASIPVSERPICGVALDATGDVLLAGSFDGTVTCLGRNTGELWRYDCAGEIWSVACSSDAALVAAGSGDGFTHLLRHDCTTGTIRELDAARSRSITQPPHRLNISATQRAIACGATSYVLNTISDALTLDSATGHESIPLIDHLMRAEGGNLTSDAQFRIAELFARLGEPERAIELCQRLSTDPEQQSRALKLAGDCFDGLGMRNAADTCFRRANESLINQQGIRLLYDLARNYEERGQYGDATKQYEFLLSWDIGFRDARRRLQVLEQQLPAQGAYEDHLDYTGLTVSMLGPDVPRDKEVDASLQPVLAARMSELFLPPGERTRLLTAIDVMDSQSVFSASSLPPLPYDAAAYIKYEFSPPEDTVKKFLEMAAVVAELEGVTPHKSLDIGTATCRYPQFLSDFGIKFTYGIDISANGFRHMCERGMRFNRFIQGDGRSLPFADESMDLITCMMGTLNHLYPVDRVQLLLEARRVLVRGGILLCGIWDTNCPYQSYLSMYDNTEKLMFRSNPLTTADFLGIVRDLGFPSAHTRSFCCFPDQFVYDLDLEKLDLKAVQQLCDVDLAVRARFEQPVSQMFLGISIKG